MNKSITANDYVNSEEYKKRLAEKLKDSTVISEENNIPPVEENKPIIVSEDIAKKRQRKLDKESPELVKEVKEKEAKKLKAKQEKDKEQEQEQEQEQNQINDEKEPVSVKKDKDGGEHSVY